MAKKRVTFYIDRNVVEIVKRLAKKEGKPYEEFLDELITRGFEKLKKERGEI